MMPPFELRQLHYFVVLAEELHFGRAAQRLGIAQPSLTQQVRALERQLDAPLLTRRPRVALTESGRVFLTGARQTLMEASATASAARLAAEGRTGSLSIALAPATLLVPSLSKVIRVFREQRPGVTVRLRALGVHEQVEALRAGRVDVGFIYEPPPGLASDGLTCETLVREQIVAVLPSAHPATRLDPLPLEALSGEPFILIPRAEHPWLYDTVLGAFHRAGFMPNVVQEAPEMQTRIGLVEAGLGVTLAPASAERFMHDGVACRRLADPTAQTSIALCWRKGEQTVLAAAFVAMARAVCASR